MKARLNLTIDERLVMRVKKYAQQHDTNVSELVEQFFTRMLKPVKSATIIDFVEKLEKPDINPDINLKEKYYIAKVKF